MRVLIALCLIASYSTFAKTINLRASSINIGHITEHNGLAHKAFTLIRTSSTPKKVKLTGTFDYDYDVCVSTYIDEIYHPSTYRTVCADTRKKKDREERCRREYVPAWTEYVEKCGEYETRTAKSTKTFEVDFSKAYKLSSAHKEKFQIVVKQKGSYSKSFKSSGKFLGGHAGSYKVKNKRALGIFAKTANLKFIANP